jgi:hypothetical protein
VEGLFTWLRRESRCSPSDDEILRLHDEALSPVKQAGNRRAPTGKRVDSTRHELVTSATRRRSEDFATVRYRSKNRLNKPNPRIVSSPMFAVVRVGCRQTVVSCVHEYCALKRSLIQGFAILSDTRTCCAGGLRARGSGKGVRETTGLFYAGLWIRTSGNSSFPGNSVNRGHGVGVSLASNHAQRITGGTTRAPSTPYRLGRYNRGDRQGRGGADGGGCWTTEARLGGWP